MNIYNAAENPELVAYCPTFTAFPVCEPAFVIAFVPALDPYGSDLLAYCNFLTLKVFF